MTRTTVPQLPEGFDPDSPDKDWLNPISMSKLKRALEKKQMVVELNGKLYNIEYGHSFPLKSAPEVKNECVKLSRVDGGYVPFGYVNIDKVLRFKFEE